MQKRQSDNSSTVSTPLPPNNVGLEFSLLASVLLSERALDEILETVPSLALNDGEEPFFFNPAHTVIFEEMLGIYAEGKSVTPPILLDALRRSGRLDQVGGTPYVESFTSEPYIPQSVKDMARSLLDYWRRRRAMQIGGRLINQAPTGKSVKAIAEATIGDLVALTLEKDQREFKRIGDMIPAVIKGVEDAMRGDTRPGLQTGFADLDRMTAGFRAGELIILAARPSMGKTAFAVNIAMNVAHMQRRPVAVFSMEMVDAELIQRIICSHAKIPLGILRGHYNMQTHQLVDLKARSNELLDVPLLIDDTPALSLADLKGKAKKLILRVPDLSLIVVDYLQLMAGRGRFNESRNEVVGGNSTGLKNLAKELKVPVLALSQLSRKTEERQSTSKSRKSAGAPAPDPMPLMSDLKESGNIEQDADTIIFIHRNIYEKAPMTVSKLRIAKQRNGPTGDFELFFRGEHVQFVNPAPKTTAPEPSSRYQD